MEYRCHKWPQICSTCRKHFPVLSSFMTYHRACYQINTTGAISVVGTAYPSRAPEFTPGFQWGSCYSIFSFMCNALQIVVCPFVLFLLAIALSVLRYTDSDYTFGFFKLFISNFYTNIYKITLQRNDNHNTYSYLLRPVLQYFDGFTWLW